jgi:type II secretory pathway component PulK
MKLFHNKSGVVIVTVMWVLVMLSILAVSVGKSAHMEMAMTKFMMGRVQAKYLAFAGVNQAVDQLSADTQDEASNVEDNLGYCGIPKNANTEEIFKDVKMDRGIFSVSYTMKDEGKKETTVYGMMDEERNINLNTLTPANIRMLIELLNMLDVNSDEAKTVAYAILDWVDQDKSLVDGTYGAEEEYYNGLGEEYHCKNAPINSLPELFLIKGMTKDIYHKMIPYVTIYPQTGNFQINFDTAPRLVLQSVMRSIAETARISESDADGLVTKIINDRERDEGSSVDIEKMELDGTQQMLFNSAQPFRTKKSNYFRIHVIGDAEGLHVTSEIEAVVFRDQLTFLYWNRK